MCRLFAAVYSLNCAAASATSLDEAFVASYQNNPQIKSSIQQLQAVDEEMPSAIGGMLPTASIAGQRGVKSSKYSIANSAGITESGLSDTRSIQITEPLFKGGATYAGIKKAKSDIMAAREQFRAAEQQVLLAAATAYMDLVSNEEVYTIAKNNKAVLAKHLSATKARLDLGEVTKTDLAQSKASLAKADSELISAQFTVESSKATYEKVIGIKPVDIKMPKTPIEVRGNVDELVIAALANNPSIKLAEYNLDSAKKNIDIQKAVILPQVSAFANKQRQYGVLSGATQASTIDSDMVGINFSIPLYQSGAEYAQIRQAKHTAGQTSYNLAVVRDNVRESVVKAVQDFNVAKATIQSNNFNVEASAIAFEGMKQESNAGLRTIIELLDAQQALFNARAALIKSRRDEIVTAYNLLAQLGKLTVKDLRLKVDAYNPEENYNKVKYQIIGF